MLEHDHSVFEVLLPGAESFSDPVELVNHVVGLVFEVHDYAGVVEELVENLLSPALSCRMLQNDSRCQCIFDLLLLAQ